MSANVSFSIPERPYRMEVSYYVADGTTTVDEVTVVNLYSFIVSGIQF